MGSAAPFKEALGYIARKVILPTTLSSSELMGIDAGIREVSLLSACTSNARYLQALGMQVSDLLDGNVDVAKARLQLKDTLTALQYQPAEGEAGSIKDLSSDGRINLVLKTNKQMAEGYGSWRQGQDATILEAYPAQELVRMEDRKEKRTWRERWRAAGGKVYPGTTPGLPLEDGMSEGRLIALKDDEVWVRLSAFGLPYPPFDYNSGVDVEDVSRSEAVELGLLGPDDVVEMDTLQRDFGSEMRIDVNGLSSGLADALLESLGPEFEMRNGILQHKEAINI